MLYIDQRGTGLSTPVDADVLTKARSVEQQAGYLKHFRADNIGIPPPSSLSPTGKERIGWDGVGWHRMAWDGGVDGTGGVGWG